MVKNEILGFMMADSYILKRIHVCRLKGLGYKLVYAKCGKQLKLGEEIVSRKINGRGSYKVVLYHKECYEKLFI